MKTIIDKECNNGYFLRETDYFLRFSPARHYRSKRRTGEVSAHCRLGASPRPVEVLLFYDRTSGVADSSYGGIAPSQAQRGVIRCPSSWLSTLPLGTWENYQESTSSARTKNARPQRRKAQNWVKAGTTL